MLNFITNPALLGSHFPSAIPIQVDGSSEVPSLLSSTFKPKENVLEQIRGKEETAAPSEGRPLAFCACQTATRFSEEGSVDWAGRGKPSIASCPVWLSHRGRFRISPTCCYPSVSLPYFSFLELRKIIS